MTTVSPNKSLQEPAFNSSGWNVPLVDNIINEDQAFGGQQTFDLSSASGTVPVSGTAFVGAYPANTASYIPLTWSLTGTMTANVNLQIPSGVGGRWVVNNMTTGAFSVTVSSAGAGATISLTQGAITDFYADGTNIFAIVSGGGAALPAGSLVPYAANSTPTGFLLCYGQSVAAASYPNLFAAIGYQWGGSGANFSLPDLRGRAIAGPDDMGGTAAGVLPGYTFGTIGGAANVTLTTAQLAAHNHTDSGHSHGVSDPGHIHNLNTTSFPINGGSQTLGKINTGSDTSAPAATGISIATGHANLANTGGGASHTNTQPTAAINWIIKY